MSLSFVGMESTTTQPTENQTEFNPTNDWQVFGTYDGITVEYKEAEIQRKHWSIIVVLFKYTNTTSSDLSMTFKRSYYMDGECRNCSKINTGEHTFTVEVPANGSVEGSSSNFKNELYVFNRFTKLVPGMDDSQLTNVEFLDVEVK